MNNNTAMNTKTAKNTKIQTLRTMAAAGVIAVLASACGTSAADVAQPPTTVAVSVDAPEVTAPAANNGDDAEHNGTLKHEKAPNNEAPRPVVAPGSRPAPVPVPAPAPVPAAPRVPAPAPQPHDTPEAGYFQGACFDVEYPQAAEYQLYADTDLRSEPVVGQIVGTVFVGDTVYPYFSELECAIGTDDTVWWFVGTQNGTEAWVNSAWMDPVAIVDFGDDSGDPGLVDDTDGTDAPVIADDSNMVWQSASLTTLGVECFELNNDAACDVFFSRNDGSAGDIASTFVTAYMFGDNATLYSLTRDEYGIDYGAAILGDEEGDGFGLESLNVNGGSFSFTPYPTGTTTCYVEAGFVGYCAFQP